jgi:glycosyltransferase involved in cell wall biosynthesis
VSATPAATHRQSPVATPPDGVSVVLPVHAAIDPEHLAAALASVSQQTLVPDEVVIVADGPLTAAHDVVLAAYAESRPGVRTIRLPSNQGAGVATQTALAAARHTWVAKVDADDILVPHRLETQLRRLTSVGADVCSSAMVEFVGRPDHVVGTRTTPVDHREFARLMRFRNPVNHPTVMFRRAAAVASGGYRHLPYLEDYDLWARMLRDGATFVGVAEPLVSFRSDGMLSRRRQRSALRSELLLQPRLRGYGLVSAARMPLNLALRCGYLLLPMPLLRVAYGRIFRSRGATR